MIVADEPTLRPIYAQPSHMAAGWGFWGYFPQPFPQNLWITSVCRSLLTDRHNHDGSMTARPPRSSE